MLKIGIELKVLGSPIYRNLKCLVKSRGERKASPVPVVILSKTQHPLENLQQKNPNTPLTQTQPQKQNLTAQRQVNDERPTPDKGNVTF